MIILGQCLAGGYHISVPWGLQKIADRVYQQNMPDLHEHLESINSSFNEDQDQSILSTAGEYMAWWLDRDADMVINSDVIAMHFHMYMIQVRPHYSCYNHPDSLV